MFISDDSNQELRSVRVSKKPKVSVCCITYNHENFIRQTLDGFVMQETDFPFEVIIHDDASTDKTADIIREYEAKYPDIIKPVYQAENQYSQGVHFSNKFVFPRVQAEYVAICEGDDYWTDKTKLQKQVEFLDSHPDFSICFHPVVVRYEDGSVPDSFYPKPDFIEGEHLQVEYLLFANYIQNNSVMYRWRFKSQEELESLYTADVVPGDWLLHLLHAQVGKIGFMKDVMAVYRRHSNGAWWVSQPNDQEKLHLTHGVAELKFFLRVDQMFPQYSLMGGREAIKNFALTLFKLYLQNQRFDKMNEVLSLCPDCVNSGSTQSV